MYIPQIQLNRLHSLAVPGKVVTLFGPRRVGKTTLLKKFLDKEKEFLFVSGEDIFVRNFLSSGSIEKLKEFIGEKKLLVIDEAQYIPTIGLNLKLIVDHIPDVRVIATGSSTFELAKEVGAPLTGRQRLIQMFPISQLELNQLENRADTMGHLPSRLIYGSYPEIITLQGNQERQDYLRELVSSYLMKDILIFEGIHKSKKVLDLLTLLAFQVGKEVSVTEIATTLGMNRVTVERYLDLLEQVFVIYNIRGFSRNLRKEVTKTSRYYFYDNGIRNMLINNFNPLERRDDVGLLWENYLAMERIKKQHYQLQYSRNYFWRTYDQNEIDWVEEREGNLWGFEFKWKEKTLKPPRVWKDAYPKAHFDTIHKGNYLEFIS